MLKLLAAGKVDDGRAHSIGGIRYGIDAFQSPQRLRMISRADIRSIPEFGPNATGEFGHAGKRNSKGAEATRPTAELCLGLMNKSDLDSPNQLPRCETQAFAAEAGEAHDFLFATMKEIHHGRFI